MIKHIQLLKKITVILLLLIFCFSFSGCFILKLMDDSRSKKNITEYVTIHVDALNAFPYEEYRTVEGEKAEKEFLRKTLGPNTIVKSVYRYSSDIL